MKSAQYDQTVEVDGNKIREAVGEEFEEKASGAQLAHFTECRRSLDRAFWSYVRAFGPDYTAETFLDYAATHLDVAALHGSGADGLAAWYRERANKLERAPR